MSSLASVVHEHQYQNQSASGGVKHTAAAYDLNVYDSIVVADTSGGAFAVVLPSVAEAAGRTYQFKILSGTTALTVGDLANDSGYSDQTINAITENLEVRSDGKHWIEVITE